MFNLKLIDDLFEHYRSKLTGDDEDIDILVLAVLEQLSKEEILEYVTEMDELELRSFMGVYITETLKEKFALTNPASTKDPSSHDFRNIH
ncbi:DUF6154 family protein [Peribacillus faecalis]|uniref:DUF6154 family protein n=1 Tax=Peribacillus faecalis TaxID=2772559 RepID=UPI0038B315B8